MRQKSAVFLTGLLTLSIALTGCGDTATPKAEENEQVTETGSDNKETADTGSEDDTQATDDAKASSTDINELFTDRDFDTDYDESSCIKITFSDTDVQSDAASVTADGTTATITDEGSYLLSGSCEDGMVVVDTDAKVQLILDGLDLCKDTSAALYVRSADKVFVTLADGSNNSLSSTGEYAAIDDNNIDGTIFSKDDITLNGSGSLSISSESGHGIVGKDDLKVTGGTYNISTAKHGISSNNSIRISDGSFTTTTVKDSLHTAGYLTVLGGDFSLTSDDDALHADGTLNIAGGTIAIGKSLEGIEGDIVNISDGDITLSSDDDGINAGSSLNISGGSIQLAIGGDGLDSNGSLNISGGEIYINGPAGSGDGMLDYTGPAVISGGTLLAAGSMGMVQNFSEDSTQCSILLSTDSQTAGTAVTLTDNAGNELISWTPAANYNGVLISCPDLAVGETYTVQSGSFSETITLETTIYGSGSGKGGMGGKGGMRPDGEFNGEKGTRPEGDFNGEKGTRPEGDFNGEETGGRGGMRGQDGTDGDKAAPPEDGTDNKQTSPKDIFENEEGDSV